MVGSKVMLFICSTPPDEEVDAFLVGVEVDYPCVCDCRRSKLHWKAQKAVQSWMESRHWVRSSC